ncbi:glycosyltransferase family 4 protein [Dictyobacter formicarum]|uniref:Glycosyltransferase WbuB n=1 Tax=Dictyobacter formicarum TaxID=2778368 RepID=A0ABQ3VAR9_9CHLR|nr:glycosyltransferase family 4 protein [Dictyobacter formicarum]GHO82748.1 glycosyltransferase WbuB [Dictyobacter formicarum]
MTHILFVTPYYPPEITPPAIRIREMAMQLVKLEYQVTVLTTFPNFPSGIVSPDYRGHRILQEQRDGLRIIRVWSYIRPNKGFLRRILSQFSFGCLAPFFGMKAVGQPDVIIVESPPLFNAIAGRILAWRKQCPFIFTVADLWPEVAVQMGMLRNRFLIRLAEWLEWSTYRRAALVWVVTQGLRNILIERGLPANHIFVLTNGVDCTKFHPLPQAQAQTELGWDDRFTVLYAGSHGPSHGLSVVLDTAEHLLEHKDIRFVLAGNGAEKEELVTEAQRRGLHNIVFLEPQPHDRIPLLLAASDACLALAHKAILFQGVLPAKMYEAMACARPIVLAVDGEACKIAVHDAGSAIYAKPENPVSFASAILFLRDHPEEAARLGEQGRTFVEKRFDHRLLAATLDHYIKALLHKDKTNAIPSVPDKDDDTPVTLEESPQPLADKKNL